jgi:hypothetical protein
MYARAWLLSTTARQAECRGVHVVKLLLRLSNTCFDVYSLAQGSFGWTACLHVCSRLLNDEGSKLHHTARYSDCCPCCPAHMHAILFTSCGAGKHTGCNPAGVSHQGWLTAKRRRVTCHMVGAHAALSQCSSHTNSAPILQCSALRGNKKGGHQNGCDSNGQHCGWRRLLFCLQLHCFSSTQPTGLLTHTLSCVTTHTPPGWGSGPESTVTVVRLGRLHTGFSRFVTLRHTSCNPTSHTC